MILVFEYAFARGVYQCASLEGEIVRHLSVSLSPTLSRNEKVDQYIRKKIHKPNSLRFWVDDSVIHLCGSDFCLILV